MLNILIPEFLQFSNSFVICISILVTPLLLLAIWLCQSHDKIYSYEGKPIYVVNDRTVRKYSQYLDQLLEDYVIGLDIEWVPKSDTKIPIIQICGQKSIFIFQLLYLNEIPKQLEKCLLNPCVIKSGVNIYNDISLFYNSYNILISHCIDLRQLSYMNSSYGLERMAQEYLGVSKLKMNVNHYLWNDKYLTYDNIIYGAGDAWASYELLITLYYQYNPRDISYDDLDQWIESMITDGRKYQGVNDFEIIKNNNNENSNRGCSSNSNSNNKNNKKKNEMTIKPRSKPLYENCYVYGPDDNFMFMGTRNKIDWYLKKNLAELIEKNDDYIKIRLTFTPKGNGKGDESNFLTYEDNRCVICGSYDNYVKHSIIPHAYRKYFPDNYKNHYTHDIVLLCSNCQYQVNIVDTKFMKELHKKFNVDFHKPLFCVNKSLFSAIKAAKALTNHKVVIPSERRSHLYELVVRYLGHQPEDDELTELAKLDISSPNDQNIRPPAQELTQLFLDNDYKGLYEFVLLWRNHFLESFQPNYMPKYWKLDNPIANLNDILCGIAPLEPT